MKTKKVYTESSTAVDHNTVTTPHNNSTHIKVKVCALSSNQPTQHAATSLPVINLLIGIPAILWPLLLLPLGPTRLLLPLLLLLSVCTWG
jgi:hypothetical protein